MLLNADAARIPLADASVHCVVTSPPYFGLRVYSGEQDRSVLHRFGLEETPEAHIENIVQVMREVYRVLRDDGVVYFNYGDAFDGGNLLMLPHRIALALQADGWIVRQDIVWAKANPMPESVNGWRWERERRIVSDDTRGREDYRTGAYASPQRDHGADGGFAQPEYDYGDDLVLRRGSWRHTRAHEFIFMLVKKMGYFSNQEAVREALSPTTANDPRMNDLGRKYGGKGRGAYGESEGANGQMESWSLNKSGRNPRSVMHLASAPYKGSHYAVFSPQLIAPLIRASCPARCCPECGAGWAPVVAREVVAYSASKNQGGCKDRNDADDGRTEASFAVTGYLPTCDCGRDDWVPGICLDPFIGSGTTGMVAAELGLRWVGLDISMPYLDEQAKPRAMKLTPATALEELPLFANNFDQEAET